MSKSDFFEKFTIVCSKGRGAAKKKTLGKIYCFLFGRVWSGKKKLSVLLERPQSGKKKNEREAMSSFFFVYKFDVLTQQEIPRTSRFSRSSYRHRRVSDYDNGSCVDKRHGLN